MDEKWLAAYLTPQASLQQFDMLRLRSSLFSHLLRKSLLLRERFTAHRAHSALLPLETLSRIPSASPLLV